MIEHHVFNTMFCSILIAVSLTFRQRTQIEFYLQNYHAAETAWNSCIQMSLTICQIRAALLVLTVQSCTTIVYAVAMCLSVHPYVSYKLDFHRNRQM